MNKWYSISIVALSTHTIGCCWSHTWILHVLRITWRCIHFGSKREGDKSSPELFVNRPSSCGWHLSILSSIFVVFVSVVNVLRLRIISYSCSISIRVTHNICTRHISGWWLGHPSEKYTKVSWDEHSQLNGKTQCSKPPDKIWKHGYVLYVYELHPFNTERLHSSSPKSAWKAVTMTRVTASPGARCAPCPEKWSPQGGSHRWATQNTWFLLGKILLTWMTGGTPISQKTSSMILDGNMNGNMNIITKSRLWGKGRFFCARIGWTSWAPTPCVCWPPYGPNVTLHAQKRIWNRSEWDYKISNSLTKSCDRQHQSYCCICLRACPQEDRQLDKDMKHAEVSKSGYTNLLFVKSGFPLKSSGR